MIIVVAGCFGFIGKNICSYFAHRGHKVIGIYRSKISVDKLAADNVTYVKCDLFIDFPVIEEFDVVINCAGNIGLRNIGGFKGQDLGTDKSIVASLVALVQKVNPSANIIHLGTVDEYGKLEGMLHESRVCKAISAYGRSKLEATNYLLHKVRNENIRAMVIRPSIVFGPNQNSQMFLTTLLRTLDSNRMFKMTAGEQTRNFIHINDLCRLVEIIISDFRSGEIINAAYPTSYKLKEVALAIASNVNKLELLGIGDVDYRSNEIMNYLPSSSKAEDLYGFSPQYDVLNYPKF